MDSAIVDATEHSVDQIDNDIKPEERSAKQLPVPTGYRLLLALPKTAAAYDSGILRADQSRRNDEIASVVGFVMAMGPDAYQDKVKFPSGPYCKIGDFVLMQTYAGTRFMVHGEEFRIVNDDTVLGIIDDPRGYTRVQ